ncbi:MAG: hypothetical protein ACOCV2_11835, partial [Persicimonas sp.]
DDFAHDRDLFDDESDEELMADGGAASEPILEEAAEEAQPGDAFFDEEFESEVDDEEAISEPEALDEESVVDPSVDPPEMDAILHPERIEHEPIEPLPQPGPPAEPALLTAVAGGEVVGEVLVDEACTVLGVDDAGDSADESDSGAGESDEEIEAVELEADELEYELEMIPEDEDEAAVEEDEVFDLDEASDVSLEEASSNVDAQGAFEEEDFEAAEAFEEESFGDEDSFADEAFEGDDSEVAEESVGEIEPVEEPEDGIDEGTLVDLSQFGDVESFARRYAYLFRHNKHFTLYVLSDKGAQVNDELLALGDYRELQDGDVVILGGEVALRFEAPAA